MAVNKTFVYFFFASLSSCVTHTHTHIHKAVVGIPSACGLIRNCVNEGSNHVHGCDSPMWVSVWCVLVQSDKPSLKHKNKIYLCPASTQREESLYPKQFLKIILPTCTRTIYITSCYFSSMLWHFWEKGRTDAVLRNQRLMTARYVRRLLTLQTKTICTVSCLAPWTFLFLFFPPCVFLWPRRLSGTPPLPRSPCSLNAAIASAQAVWVFIGFIHSGSYSSTIKSISKSRHYLRASLLDAYCNTLCVICNEKKWWLWLFCCCHFRLILINWWVTLDRNQLVNVQSL